MTIDPKPGDSVKEFWFTQKDNDLFAFSPEWPSKSQFTIKDAVATSDTKVTLMGCDKVLPYTQTEEGITVDISSINFRDFKSQFVFGFKLSNIK